MTLDTTLPQPARPRRGSSIISVAIGACAMYYAWIWTIAPGDFQGDSWEYLSIAARMREGSFELFPYNYLRGLMYPWLLSATWGTDGFWTYFFQAALFLTALFLAIRFLAFNLVYGLLPLLAAMIPAVAFLQRLIYPDGFLISLTLLFFVALAKRWWFVCLVLGLVLTATKLIFVVALPLALAIYILDRKLIRPALLVRAAAVGLALFPLFIFMAAYVFVDLAYMVVFARPHSHEYPVRRLFPPLGLSITCSGRDYVVPRGEVFLDPITVPWAIAPYGPLTAERAKAFGCTPIQLRALKWQVVKSGFAADPALHLRLGAKHFATALVGGYQVGHVSYILALREQSWRAHYDQQSYFEPYEIELLPEYGKKGFDVSKAGPSPIFGVNRLSVRLGEPIIRWTAVGLFALSLAIAPRRRVLAKMVQDPVNMAMVFFLLAYSGLMSLLGPFVYDRYAYVNLLCLCILAARLAGQSLGITIPTSLPETASPAPTVPMPSACNSDCL